MWLGVLTPTHGRLCVDVCDEDSSVYAVRQKLKRILKMDISLYDLMLGKFELTDSMLLADFGLPDGYSDLSLSPRVLERDTTEQDDTIASADPILESTPNISQADPIMWTQAGSLGKCAKKRKKSGTYTKRNNSTMVSEERELLWFPKWRKEEHVV